MVTERELNCLVGKPLSNWRQTTHHTGLPSVHTYFLQESEAIELYRQQAERLIAMRDRKNYQAAINPLTKMRTLYDKLGERETWTNYITTLREQNRNLRALKEELAKAGL